MTEILIQCHELISCMYACERLWFLVYQWPCIIAANANWLHAHVHGLNDLLIPTNANGYIGVFSVDLIHHSFNFNSLFFINSLSTSVIAVAQSSVSAISQRKCVNCILSEPKHVKKCDRMFHLKGSNNTYLISNCRRRLVLVNTQLCLLNMSILSFFFFYHNYISHML